MVRPAYLALSAANPGLLPLAFIGSGGGGGGDTAACRMVDRLLEWPYKLGWLVIVPAFLLFMAWLFLLTGAGIVGTLAMPLFGMPLAITINAIFFWWIFVGVLLFKSLGLIYG